MKKRTIITFIITIVCVILTNKFWLIFKPIPVSFDILGNGNYNVEVFLSKKDNNEFKKVKTQDKDISLDGTIQHLDFFIKQSRYPKRMKIIITELPPTNDKQTNKQTIPS